MRIFNKFKLSLLIVLIFLSGCIVQSRQLNGLLELITEPSLDLSPNSWLVRYSDYESVVYAISTPEGILFSNSAGDQVLFDGWAVRKVQGLGLHLLNLNIDDVGSRRTLKRGNRIVSNHRCDKWAQKNNLGVVRYFQYCSDRQDYKNSILVQNNGEISVIRQIVDERYTALTLTKLK